MTAEICIQTASFNFALKNETSALHHVILQEEPGFVWENAPHGVVYPLCNLCFKYSYDE